VLRFFILLHRYLGIGVGIILVMWCLTGFVMLYVQYPDLEPQQRRSRAPVLVLRECCRLPEADYMEKQTLDYFIVEMLADMPVLRLGWFPDDEIAINLRNGEWLDPVDPDMARRIAADYLARRQLDGELEYRGAIGSDQWTVYGKYQPHRPLHHFAANDGAGTEWYVSSTSGEIVQVTTARQRFWNWLGAVSHWLYFTQLREDTVLWSRLVIGLAALGTFLTALGIYIGIRQFRFGAGTVRRSPYKGWHLWHHYVGLLFGVFALIWVASGLISMNPWGLLESGDHAEESGRLGGRQLTWDEAREFIKALPARTLPPDVTRLEVSVLLGDRNLVAGFTAGASQRLNINTLEPEAVSAWDWLAITKALGRGAGSAEGRMIDGGDDYYFNHHETRLFPVWRVILGDADRTRYYLNPENGRILEKFDGNRQWYRWVFLALHRGDFSRLLRTRPVWDAWIILLLAGVTVVTATGTYLGFKRLIRWR
jgi:uncharacterized iron-regulated membrane protein